MGLRNGEPLIEALDAIKDKNVPLVSIMHSEVEHIDACLDILQDQWLGPIGVYAHSARWVGNRCVFDETISPQDHASLARAWLDRGVQVIGGCCGMGVTHIAALRKLV